jgi:hypothetical protein
MHSHVFQGAGGSLPIGLAEEAPKLGDVPMLREPLAMRNAEGEPVFRTNVRSVIDTADPPVLLRNALLTQQDGQGIVVLGRPRNEPRAYVGVEWSSRHRIGESTAAGDCGPAPLIARLSIRVVEGTLRRRERFCRTGRRLSS